MKKGEIRQFSEQEVIDLMWEIRAEYLKKTDDPKHEDKVEALTYAIFTMQDMIISNQFEEIEKLPREKKNCYYNPVGIPKCAYWASGKCTASFRCEYQLSKRGL